MNAHRDIARGLRGFALLDLLVALVIAAIAIASVAGVAARWQAGWHEGRRWQEAHRIADSQVDTLRALASAAASPELPRPSRRTLDGADGFRYEVVETLEHDGATLAQRLEVQALDAPTGLGAAAEPPTWHSLHLRLDPRDAAETLRRAPPPKAAQTPYRQSRGLPLSAYPAGRHEGRALSALAWGTGALLFDAGDGRLRWQCDRPVPGGADDPVDLRHCRTATGVMVQGWLHAPAAWIGDLVPQARPLSPGGEAPQCVVEVAVDAGGVDRDGLALRRYRCRLPWPAAADATGDAGAAGWSGALQWRGAPSAVRHCAATDGAGPAGSYTGLLSSLDHQNHWFRPDTDCPAGSRPADDG